MHFNSPGKRFLAGGKPWRPDTKRFDCWKGVVEERYVARSNKIAGEIVKCILVGQENLDNSVVFEFASLPKKHKETVRQNVNLIENQIFAKWVQETRKLNLEFNYKYDETSDTFDLLPMKFLIPENLAATKELSHGLLKKFSAANAIADVTWGLGNRRHDKKAVFLEHVLVAIEHLEHGFSKYLAENTKI